MLRKAFLLDLKASSPSMAKSKGRWGNCDFLPDVAMLRIFLLDSEMDDSIGLPFVLLLAVFC